MRGKSSFALLAAALTLCACAGAQPPGPLSKRIVLAGDSTVAAFGPDRAPQAGWGQELDYFLAGGVEVDNRAISGRSTKSFRDEGRWDALVAALAPGDLVLIQFGHNDPRVDAPERYAPADTDFRDNLVRFVAEVRARGAQAVLVTPVARRLWEGPVMVDTHALYAAAMARAAADAHAPLLDLNRASLRYFQRFGRAETKRDYLFVSAADANPLFPEGVEDNTHFTALGACGAARLVAQGLIELGPPYAALVSAQSIGAESEAGQRPAAVLACAAR